MNKKNTHFPVRKVAIGFLLLFSSSFVVNNPISAQSVFDPSALFASWVDNPESSISITWVTPGEEEEVEDRKMRAAVLEYRLKDSGDRWKKAEPLHNPFPFSSKVINRVDLDGLRPDTRYTFRIQQGDSILSSEYYFRTMPATIDRPITFATGGDTRADIQFEKTNVQVMKHDPDFIMIGGDLAYENGSPLRAETVMDWLDVAKRTLITEDGRLVPIIASIGDHEGRRGFPSGFFEKLRDEAPYYYALFAFPGVPGYNVVDVGDYISIVVLQAGFGAAVDGPQTEWLQRTLEARKEIPHIFPIYHHGIYPSIRPVHKAEKENWAPLFEKYGIYVAFENHDHAYKRTYPIKDGKKVSEEEGIVYLGDGSWGQLRTNQHADSWYLAKALPTRSFIIGHIEPGQERFQFKMYNQEGQLIDSYPQTK